MRPFEIGDRVICVDNTSRGCGIFLTIDKVYEVLEYIGSDNIRVLDDEGLQLGYCEYRFVKYNKKELI